MERCIRCNYVNADGMAQCAYCGAPLSAAVMQQQMQFSYGGYAQSSPYGTGQFAQPPDQAMTVAQSAFSPQQGLQPLQDYSGATQPQQPQTTQAVYAGFDYSQHAGMGYMQPMQQDHASSPAMDYAQPAGMNYAQPAASNYAYHQAAESSYASTTAKQKSKVVAGLLALFLGGIGIHRFYLGNTKAGIINIVIWLTIIGIPVTMIIALIEGIKYLTMSQEKFNQEYVVGHKAWF